MRLLRVATIVFGLCLCLISSLVYGFGPLPVGHGTSVSPSCAPPYPLSRLRQHFSIGMTSAYGQASVFMAATGVPWDYRYVYLNGGYNTGCAPGVGWQSYAAPNGQFALNYVQESQATAAGYETLFIDSVIEADGGYGNTPFTSGWVQNTANMNCIFNDFTLMLQKSAAGDNGGAAIMIQVEPDMWGFIEELTTGDNPATVPVAVASSNYTAPDSTHPLASLPNNAIGLAQAFIILRNKIAPGIILAYPISLWGTPNSYAPIGSSQAVNTTAGNQAGAFYNKLGAAFDIATFETSDMDPGYFLGTPNGVANCNGVGAGERGWWSATDALNFSYAVAAFTATTGKKSLIWQTPAGNTVFLGQDNSRTFHYQGDLLQYWLQAGNPNLAPLIAAGAIGLDISQGQQAGTVNQSVCPNAGTHNQSDTDIYNASGVGTYNPAPTAIPVAAQGIFPGNGTATFKSALYPYDDGGYGVWQGGIYYANSPPAVCP